MSTHYSTTSEREEQFRALFETLAQGVVYQNAQGEIIAANPAAERILGLTLDQMQGRTSGDPRWRAVREDGSPAQRCVGLGSLGDPSLVRTGECNRRYLCRVCFAS